MIKLLGCLLFVPILAHGAEPVNYFDKNGQLFMQSNRVNNQVIYTDPIGRLVAIQSSVATPVLQPLAPKNGLVLIEFPQLQGLPTLELLK